MYLVDTDVLSESRKSTGANAGVREFFAKASREASDLFVSAITIGELRQGVERIRHRGDLAQAEKLEHWLIQIAATYSESILAFDADVAQIWGRLRVPNAENPLDKQIAATALIYDLTVVTRNTEHFRSSGVRLLNPFS